MVNASKECKTLLLIVDEENKIRTLYDDVILDGPPLPRVITPRKLPRSAEGEHGEEEHGEAREEAEQGEGEDHGHEAEQGEGEDNGYEAEEEEGEEEQTEQGEGEFQGEETDSDFDESEYDVEDLDDDLFVENMDIYVNDNNGKEGYIEEDPLDDDDLNLNKDELSKLQYTFKAYNPEVVLNNPVFRVGLVLVT